MIYKEQTDFDKDNSFFDSGMETIWFLQDMYEQKDLDKFLSRVSSEFKKDFFIFASQLIEKFSEVERIKLYIHLHSKKVDSEKSLYSYEICWSRRYKKYLSQHSLRNFGKTKIFLKKVYADRDSKFLLYDICGDNPFF